MQLTSDQFLSLLRQVIQEEMAALKLLRQEDRLLTAKEAAKLLTVSPRWLYKEADLLPYTVRLSKTVVRFSFNRIQQEIKTQLKGQERRLYVRDRAGPAPPLAQGGRNLG